MLLYDCILSVLAEGGPHTANRVARRLGADRVTVADHLAKLYRRGFLALIRRPRRAGVPLDIFVPIRRRLAALAAGPRQAQSPPGREKR